MTADEGRSRSAEYEQGYSDGLAFEHSRWGVDATNYQRLTERLVRAEARIIAALDICDRHERGALRWADPLPVPEWVGEMQRALLGDRPSDDASRVVPPGGEDYEDAFDVCPEPTCPLYGKAVMADHRHLPGNASSQTEEPRP